MSMKQILDELQQMSNVDRLAVIHAAANLIGESLSAPEPPPQSKREENQAAYRRLKPWIEQTFPVGRYVAIHDGRVVADAGSVAELVTRTHELGLSPRDGLAVQVGVDYPDYATLF